MLEEAVNDADGADVLVSGYERAHAADDHADLDAAVSGLVKPVDEPLVHKVVDLEGD